MGASVAAREKNYATSSSGQDSSRRAAKKGFAHAYNIKSCRDEERRWVEQAETAYARFASGWNPRGPKRVRTGTATEARR